MKLGHIVASLALLTMTACGGGGGGGGGSNTSGTISYTHAELARIFVDRLWEDAGIDAELVKTNTEQYDYIVVYDWDFGTYDAYYIGDYTVGEDILSYLDFYDWDFYYNLDVIGDNLYQDWDTGLIFEKTADVSKDLLKVEAIKEGFLLKKNADNIAAEYGLSEARAMDVAKLTLQWKNTPKGRMTDADHDAFAKEILGHSISDFKSAAEAHMQGNGAALADLVQGTAEHNGVTPEEVNEIIQDVFQVSAVQ